MKLKMVILDMEADSIGATDDLCKALANVIDAVFPFEPHVEIQEADSALTQETKEG